MRSASSSTRYETPERFTAFSSQRSSSRPGVAISTCAPAAHCLRCSFFGTPPYTHTVLMPSGFPAASSTTALCIASSRVGASTRKVVFIPPPLCSPCTAKDPVTSTAACSRRRTALTAV